MVRDRARAVLTPSDSGDSASMVSDAHATDSPAPVEDSPPRRVETNAEKRRKIVNEVLSTEESYVNSLEIMLNVCRQPLYLIQCTRLMDCVGLDSITCAR
jgi:hypothetical protein